MNINPRQSRSLDAGAAPVFSSVEEMIRTQTPTEPVYCLHPGIVTQTVAPYLDLFKGDVLYAVKANPAAPLLDALYAAGIRHFDTASIAEVRAIKQRYPDAKCYYMAPVRVLGTSAEAYHEHGIRDFVLDSEEELVKILTETSAKDLTLYVRLKTDVGGAILELSSKFGTDGIEAARLLKMVNEKGCKPALAFHVGSLCTDPEAFSRALEICQKVIDLAGVELDALDVGGGFPAPYPGTHTPPLADYLNEINRGVAALNLSDKTRIICEPGRGLSAYGVSLVTQVIGRRGDQIYLNDGIYGSFDEMTVPNSYVIYPSRAIRVENGQLSELSAEQKAFTVYGPTCDSIDVLPHPIDLPTDIRLGDYIHFGVIGAYSYATRTNFNGFYPTAFATIEDGSTPPPGL